jgi:hypothetical protein
MVKPIAVEQRSQEPTYETTDIKFAAFLRVKGIPLYSYSSFGKNKAKLRFVFSVASLEIQGLWRDFTNGTEGAKVDAERVLSEYEKLRQLRFSNEKK